MVGGIAAIFFVIVIQNIVAFSTPGAQKHILTGLAVGNGLIIGIGLAPMSTIAASLVPLSPLLTSEYITLISATVKVGTAVELVFGLLKMVGGSGLFGAAAFLVAFIAGIFLPFRSTMVIAIVVIGFCLLAVEASPSDF